MACNRRTGSFELADFGCDGCVELEFAVQGEVGSHLLGESRSLLNLGYCFVEFIVVAASLCGEREHCDPRLYAGDGLCRLCGGNGDVGELFCRGFDIYGAVGKYRNAVGIVRIICALGSDHDEAA